MTSPTAPPPDREIRTVPGLTQFIERAIFASRWMLAPLYLGLTVSLLLLLGKFVQGTVELALRTPAEKGETLITGILALIDLSLMGNLLVMVMFAGYENFVSRFSEVTKGNQPDWMGHVGFGALKLKLMTSIIAITAIHLLEDFMHISEVTDRQLGWSLGILIAFVASGLLLATMDRISGSEH